jgi:site-specific recombinase XerD
MVNVSVYCKATKIKKDGEMPVWICVSTKEGRFYVSTGLTTRVKFYGREFPKSERNSKAKTSLLGRYLLKAEEICLMNEGTSNAELKKLLLAKLFDRKPHLNEKVLADYVRDYASLVPKASTGDLYKATAKKVEAFDGSATFETVDRAWLERFEKFLRESMTVNGAAIQLRNLRAVFNRAIDDEITKNYPFRRFRIKQEATRKRSLTVEQVRALRDYPVEPWQEKYRDVWMLQFYLIGINISDLMELEKLTDGRCVYHRNKTGRLYDIAVPDEARRIIEKYKGEKHVLRFIEEGTARTFAHNMNEALKKIGASEIVRDKVGKLRKVEYHPLFPDLTTYWNRHSWATIAASLDIPKEVIGKALGHSEWDSTTTDIYIDFDMRKVDEANRKVIDFVNG